MQDLLQYIAISSFCAYQFIYTYLCIFTWLTSEYEVYIICLIHFFVYTMNQILFHCQFHFTSLNISTRLLLRIGII